jgi:hypothetical protein
MPCKPDTLKTMSGVAAEELVEHALRAGRGVFVVGDLREAGGECTTAPGQPTMDMHRRYVRCQARLSNNFQHRRSA